MSRVLLLIALTVSLCSCQTIRKVVKAKPADRSPFLQHREQMTRRPPDAAFQFSWDTPAAAERRKAAAMREIFVAPVSLSHLRPMMTGKVRGSDRRGASLSPEAPALAVELQREFTAALLAHPGPRYRVVSRPGSKTMILEMTITELNPTSPGMNAAKLAAKIALGPVGTIGGLAVRSSGNVAVEGRLTAGKGGKVVYQFADNESDKLTFYSIRDFRPYAHARVAIKEWARQFAALSQSPGGTKIKDASFWTLSPL